MAVISDGFIGRRSSAERVLPPGQYLTNDFPVLSAGPTPVVSREQWTFDVTDVWGEQRRWNFNDLLDAGPEDIEADLHCVTGWSKFDTHWRGITVDALLQSAAVSREQHVLVHSTGGYTTNVPVSDLLDRRAWLVYEYESEPLTPEHGGPVRLLVPHLYLWKSAKWVRAFNLTRELEYGFWERLGYHEYGDPWQEQRYSSD